MLSYVVLYRGLTRGFAKSAESLQRAIALFVHCWNARQLLRQRCPRVEFISLRI